MRKVLILSILWVVLPVFALAQTDRFWQANTRNRGSIPVYKAVNRLSYPKNFLLFDLNTETMKQELFSIVGRSVKHSAMVSLPNADGAIEQFEVFEASNFEPELQARFPEIRAYSGRGVTDRYASVKLSFSPQGLQAMVFRAGTQTEFMEPYSPGSPVYAVYRSERSKGSLPWNCSTAEEKIANGLNNAVSAMARVSDGKVRTMRLALSCNGEYANYFGATNASQSALVLAAFNATLARCNGVFEKDLSLHLNLIANTTSVIYYSPATDPYTTLSNWNLQLQQTLTSVIGSANYDIGHMFGASGGGGNAGCIGCVCVNPATSTSLAKGAGITSPADGIPQGDNFDIDYVAHEMGHQLGANHTFSHALEGSGQNKEVGSGITIMGYAGITAYDVAAHSIAIFHETSINQIQNNLAGKTCPVSTVMTGNAPPVVNTVGNFIIPISTPFALTGSATDPNGDALTYCWEQDDNSTVSGASSVASQTKTGGPNWISFLPTASGTRYFTQMATTLTGSFVTGPLAGGDAGANTEALSSVGRTLNFVLTVRDNHPYVAGSAAGQSATVSSTVSVTGSAGPFTIISPNTAISWVAGAQQIVSWSVNNTNVAPVNCANVKISLSTDGGNTFPTVLAASTPNDGNETVTMPNITSGTCRIKVEAIGNIFFDISNTNFSLVNAGGCATPTMNYVYFNNQPAGLVYLYWSPVAGATSYNIWMLPPYSGAPYLYQSNVISASGNYTLSAGSCCFNSGVYGFAVSANCAGGTSPVSNLAYNYKGIYGRQAQPAITGELNMIKMAGREPATGKLFAWPVPAAGRVHMAYTGEVAAAAQLTVKNQLGNTVINRKIFLHAGVNNIPLDVQTLPPGIYQANLYVNGREMTTRLVIAR